MLVHVASVVEGRSSDRRATGEMERATDGGGGGLTAHTSPTGYMPAVTDPSPVPTLHA